MLEQASAAGPREYEQRGGKNSGSFGDFDQRSYDFDSIEKNLLKTINKALEESQKLQADRMKEITGGMHIPGLF